MSSVSSESIDSFRVFVVIVASHVYPKAVRPTVHPNNEEKSKQREQNTRAHIQTVALLLLLLLTINFFFGTLWTPTELQKQTNFYLMAARRAVSHVHTRSRIVSVVYCMCVFWYLSSRRNISSNTNTTHTIFFWFYIL